MHINGTGIKNTLSFARRSPIASKIMASKNEADSHCSPLLEIPGLNVATCGVASAARFYSVVTNCSRLVIRLATRIF